jgi:hypothetical protein
VIVVPLAAVALAVTGTVPFTVVPPAGAVIDTVGGVLLTLFTVTVTPALVVDRLFESVATAFKVWLPFVSDDVLHEKVYGAELSAEPTFAPSTCSCTLEIVAPLDAAALALTATVPFTVEPPAGAVIDAVGGVGVLLALFTFTLTPALVVDRLFESVATAVSV